MAVTRQMRERRELVRAMDEMATAIAGGSIVANASINVQPPLAPRAGAAARRRPDPLIGPVRGPTINASSNAFRFDDYHHTTRAVADAFGGPRLPPAPHRLTMARPPPATGPSAKRRYVEDVEELDAHRKRIRTLERENASIQRRYQETRMSMAQGELVMQALRDQVESMQRELVRQREELNASRREGHCIVCMAEVASHVVVPCGHLAYCQECSSLASSRCPLCRQRAEHIIRVFRP